MSLVLNLPSDLETKLVSEASHLGLSLSDYVIHILERSRNDRAAPARLQSGAELVRYWETEQLVGTRPDITDSQAHARNLRQEAERRRRP
jgi:hypothetical protein